MASCGAVWLCAVCNAKIAARRALEVAAALSWAGETDTIAYFGALTSHHVVTDPLNQSLATQSAAWKRMIQGRGWTDLVEQAGGRIWTIRSQEINTGPNGWHVHFHPVLLMPRAESRGAAEHVAAAVLDRWMRSVAAVGGKCLPAAQKLDPVITLGDIGTYITAQTYGGKSSRLDLEMTNAQGKAGMTGKHGTQSHWAIIADLASGRADNAHSAAKYYELEAYTRNVRQITWSPALRREVGLVQLSDEEAAAAVEGLVVATMTPVGWERIIEVGLGLRSLRALETGGWPAVADLWDAYGVEYTETAAT